MRTYLARRLLMLFPTVLVIVFLVFMTLHMAPGDLVDLMFDMERMQISEEHLQRLRADLGLDQPLPVQFARYLGRVARLDLGRSFTTRGPVAEEIARNVPATVQLAAAGMLVAVFLGVPAGILAAIYKNTWIDYAALLTAVIGLSAPNFWLGILLLYVFGYVLGWLPIISIEVGTLSVASLRSLILPAITVGTSGAALLARLTRSTMLEILGQDYVRTARSKGLGERRVILVHVLRNAAIPVVTAMGFTFLALIGGSVIVEMVFTRQGLGWLLIRSINNRDFPLLQGIILVFGTVVVLANLAIDLLYGALDPRVQYD